MELVQLQIFAALANELNFRQTARRLGISQSAVSRKIAELEQELGIPLFYRSNRSVALSEEGAAYLPYALDILGTAQSAGQLMEGFKRGAAGHLSISALTTCCTVLTTVLDAFFKHYPDVLVDVAFQTAADQQAALSEKQYDVHFAHKDMLRRTDSMEWMVTHTDSMALVVPKGHSLTGKPLDFKELDGERFIVSQEPGNPVLYEQIMAICEAHDYRPNITNRYDKVESVLLAVSAGLGVSIMPSALPGVLLANSVDVIPITDMDTRRTYVAAWPKNLANPQTKVFLDVLREICGAE